MTAWHLIKICLCKFTKGQKYWIPEHESQETAAMVFILIIQLKTFLYNAFCYFTWNVTTRSVCLWYGVKPLAGMCMVSLDTNKTPITLLHSSTVGQKLHMEKGCWYYQQTNITQFIHRHYDTAWYESVTQRNMEVTQDTPNENLWTWTHNTGCKMTPQLVLSFFQTSPPV